MVSVTLSGPKGTSGKGGCSSLFIWDVALDTEVFMRKIFAQLRVLAFRGPGCPHTVRRCVCLAVSSDTPFGFTGAAHWLQS